MKTFIVPCWCFLDKDLAVFAFVCSPVRLSIPYPSPLAFPNRYGSFAYHTVSLYHGKARLRFPVKLDDNPFFEESCQIRLKRKLDWRLMAPILSSKGVFTFGRSGVHFRENETHCKGTVPANIGLKTLQLLAFIMSRLSNEIGVHFREKRCSLSGEVVFTFGRSDFFQFILYQIFRCQ